MLQDRHDREGEREAETESDDQGSQHRDGCGPGAQGGHGAASPLAPADCPEARAHQEHQVRHVQERVSGKRGREHPDPSRQDRAHEQTKGGKQKKVKLFTTNTFSYRNLPARNVSENFQQPSL